MPLKTASSCPVLSYLEEETDSHLSATSFQAVVQSDKVSPEPKLLPASLVLQNLPQLCCLSLYMRQHLKEKKKSWKLWAAAQRMEDEVAQESSSESITQSDTVSWLRQSSGYSLLRGVRNIILLSSLGMKLIYGPKNIQSNTNLQA